MARGHNTRGVTLVELLVALAVLGLGLGVAALLATAVIGAFEIEPVAADAHQRARSAVTALLDDVQRAGSGVVIRTDDGPGLALPAAVPARYSSGAWIVTPTPGVLTTWHARRGGGATLASPAAAGDGVLRVALPATCPGLAASCGFEPGDDLVIYAGHGRMAMATVQAVRPPVELVLAAPLVEAWSAGSGVAAVTAHGYELRADASTGLLQVVRRLGAGPATPLVDFVTRFEVEWRVAAGVPRVLMTAGGLEEAATAGPAPPAAGVVDLASWPAGENCAFGRDGAGVPLWRGDRGGASTAPVALARLGDGPWCPDAIAPTRWDLDLARVAEVRIVLGLAAADSALRPSPGLGLAGPPGRRPVRDLVVDTVVMVGRRGIGG